VLTGVVFGAVGFQLFHVLEHGLQLGYWVANPTEKPWLTPWAKTGLDGLAYWCQIWPGQGAATPRGGELLHLIGNGIFFTGVIAMTVLAVMAGVRSSSIRGTLIFQGLHVVEHVVLTLTLFIGGTPWGASTLFGQWSGTELSSHRVWWHFSVNAMATVLVLVALRSLYRAGALAVRPDGVHAPRAAVVPRFAGAVAAGVVFLEVFPAVISSIVGDPAPETTKVRNLALNDVLDPGAWWHLADPFVLIPLASIATLVFWIRREPSPSVTA